VAKSSNVYASSFASISVNLLPKVEMLYVNVKPIDLVWKISDRTL
jgi:hypothetical protein